MRVWEKAFRRSGVSVALSNGYNPRPKLSSALPLAVGIASRGEYLEAELIDDLEPQVIESALLAALPRGMSILSMHILPYKSPAIAALVQLSRFSLQLPQDDVIIWEQVCDSIMNRKEIFIQRNKGTSREASYDVRPGIIELCTSKYEGYSRLEAVIETSSKLYIRLQDLLDILTAEAGMPNLHLAQTEPLRLDMGIKKADQFYSFADYFNATLPMSK
ncbi:MAG: TIGR03936 family radical SAM-associated protein [Symbiobacteriaceae bacterium]|nr:TIGR03936 family radical SAM-associated protein [Symbiobacteriaceae bacterium]